LLRKKRRRRGKWISSHSYILLIYQMPIVTDADAKKSPRKTRVTVAYLSSMAIYRSLAKNDKSIAR